MAGKTAALRTAIANAYKSIVPYGGLVNGDPGSTGSASTELSGGTPAYARQANGWGAAANSAVSGSSKFDVPSGATVAGWIGTAGSVVGAADVLDYAALTPQSFSSQGSYTVTPVFQQA